MRKRQIEFVTKISKLCNLRCTYCYEYEELADTRRLSLENFARMLANMKEHVQNEWERVCFIWHGGEPLLIKARYYQEMGRLEREVLGDDVPWRNVTQTNLTALSPEMLDFIAGKTFFAGIGVSVDPFGTERVDTRGRLSNEHVLDNMQRLIDRNVAFGCITVLTPKSLPFLGRTFKVFDELGISFRVLPYDCSATEAQATAHTLTGAQHVAAFTTLFDLWLASPGRLKVDPIYDYLMFALRYRHRVEKEYWDMWRDEAVFTVELDGSLWGRPRTYEPGATYGNLIEQDLETILTSDNRRRDCEEAAARQKTYCAECPYFGYCPGKYVAYASNVERTLLAASGCWVRQVIDHINMRLDEIGIDAVASIHPADPAIATAIANA